jgi:hypothetical protein
MFDGLPCFNRSCGFLQRNGEVVVCSRRRERLDGRFTRFTPKIKRIDFGVNKKR